MKSFTAIAAFGAVVAPVLAALPPVSVRGNAFYANNQRFYMRGVAYQPGGAADAKDPLLDIENLKRDVANFKDLGINTIRVYTIDNSKNHDEGMKMLDDAGIYLALDANTPKYSLNRESEATLRRSYNDVYLQNVFATVDAFADYSNLLLFFSGNEVINEKNNTNAAPYIKAVTRDMKQYISNRKGRKIPVGYSAADVAENIEEQALYFNCGSDDARSDFFALNDYSWCDPSSFEEAGWDKKVETYGDYGIPLFLSEYGCITNTRQWGEIAALYSTKMTGVYSGGLAYEYTVEPNGYGIVEIGSDGKITPNDDFKRLKAAFTKTKNPTGAGGATTDGKASTCPKETDDWAVSPSGLPAMPKKASAFMSSGAGTGKGLSGSGSHFAGEASSGTASAGSGEPTRTPNGDTQAGNATGGDNAEGAAAGLDAPVRLVAAVVASVLFGAVFVL